MMRALATPSAARFAALLPLLWTSSWVSSCNDNAPTAAAPVTEEPPDSGPAPGHLTRDQLLDPQTCQSCHPHQYEEWAGSMHAYAAQDPVFVAMNARGQEETEGKLGTFCVNCHAPMAVRDGLTTDGLNLSELPSAYQGVTCYFCHSVDDVEGLHNNPLRLSNDRVMRGPFSDPAPNSAHASAYSPWFDKNDHRSAKMCGACHDVAVEAHFAAADVLLERSYAEWQDTLFNAPVDQGGLTCNGCHMPISSRRDQSVPGPDMPKRRSRRHDFEGVDLALDSFAGRERQRVLVQQFLDSSLLAELCVSRDGVVRVTLENASAGHHWPSGASHDRLAWLNLRIYDTADRRIYQTREPETIRFGSGDAGAVDDDFDDGGLVFADPITLTDHVVDVHGEPAHMFWEVAEVARSTTLKGIATTDPLSPDYHRERSAWDVNTLSSTPNEIGRVELTVNLRPVKLSVLKSLVDSGHLASAIAESMPTLQVLPERCYSQAEIDTHPDVLVGARTDCDPEAAQHATTLTWTRQDAVPSNRNFRETVIDQSPALCLAHPTYIPPDGP